MSPTTLPPCALHSCSESVLRSPVGGGDCEDTQPAKTTANIQRIVWFGMGVSPQGDVGMLSLAETAAPGSLARQKEARRPRFGEEPPTSVWDPRNLRRNPVIHPGSGRALAHRMLRGRVRTAAGAGASRGRGA